MSFPASRSTDFSVRFRPSLNVPHVVRCNFATQPDLTHKSKRRSRFLNGLRNETDVR